jgi:TolB-like protein/Tfp pilus assembly protein PilF
MTFTRDQGAAAARRVFISYAREDRSRVEPLVAALEAHGWSVWIDSRLIAGTEFAAEIETALRDSIAVIVVWSENSARSVWVREEASLAVELGRLVPVRIDDVKAPLGFRQYHMVNLSGWDGSADAAEIRQLTHALGTARGQGATEALSPGAVAGRRRPSRRGVALLAGAVGLSVLSGGGWWLSRRLSEGGATGSHAHSVAVLPFDNLSGDPGQDYFADGLAEEVRAALARIDSLQVAAPTSSNRFRDAKQDVGAIGRSLGVAFILNGSVRRSTTVVRVAVQLSEASSGFVRWSQTYDRSVTDIIAIQGDIAELVASALRVKVLGANRLTLGGTNNPEAYDAYLKGRQALYGLSGGEATYRQALADFDAALQADPTFASAQALRARTLIAIAGQFARAEEIPALTREALEAAGRAVSLAPDLDIAQSALAFARLYGGLDVRGAAAPFERSRQLGQGDADVLARYGLYAARTGKVEAAMTALQRAAVLDPINPGVQTSLSAAFYAARRYQDAMAPLQRALALSPKMNFAHAYLGDCLTMLGRLVEARAQYAVEPSALGRLTGSAIVEHRLGRPGEAKAAFDQLVRDIGDGALYQQAQVLAQWGRLDAALDMLGRAYAARDTGLILLETDPFLDGLRHFAKFDLLRRQLGFA